MKQKFTNIIHKLITWSKQLGIYLTTGWRRKALTLFFVAFAILVIAKIVIGNWDVLSSYNWEIRPQWAFFALITFFIDFFIVLWIWHLLVSRIANYNNLYRTVKIYLYANLSRRVPGLVWYIASRAVLYQEAGVSKKNTSFLSALELAFFMISGLITTLLTLPFWFKQIGIFKHLNIVSLVLIIPLTVAFSHPRILQIIWHKLNRDMSIQELRWSDTIVWLILYVLSWVVGGLVLYAVINFFQPFPVASLITIIGIWSLAGTISLAGFITIPIIGLREIGLVFLLTQLLPAPVALIIAIVIRLLWISGELITSLISLKM